VNLFRQTSVRLVVALAASAVVLAAGGWASAAGGAPTPDSRPTGVSTLPAVTTRSSISSVGVRSTTAIGAPVAWCCTVGSTPGLSVTGQATVRGRGTAARDDAIARAVADATDQARTAAQAAGVTLGRIVDMQVSASPYAYPLGAEGVSSSGVPAPAPGVSGFSPGSFGDACPASGSCLTTAPVPVETFASVTITWAIG
jgi:hypothetical protein